MGRLKEIYRKIKIATEVDPVALIALLVALIPNIISLYYWIKPVSLTVKRPVAALFYVEPKMLRDGSRVDIVRLTFRLDFMNSHPTKKLVVQKNRSRPQTRQHQEIRHVPGTNS